MANQYESQVKFLRNIEQDKLASWFLCSFESKELELFSAKGPSPECQIQDAFENLNETQQEKVKAAVVSAIENWKADEHSGSTLESIAAISGYIGAQNAVVPLIRIIDERKVIRKSDEDDVPATIIAVINGFSPSGEVENTFNRWLNEPEFESRYAGLLLIGLATCAPEKYPNYLPRFLQIIEERPDEFLRLDYCWTEFTSLIGKQQIITHYDKLSPQSQNAFIRSLDEHAPKVKQYITGMLDNV